MEFFKKIPFYVANGFPSATGSGEGTPSLRLGSLIAEGEPPAALLRDFATFVQRLSTGPAGHRFSLLIKAMNEGSDAFTRALADLQSQLGARNKELIGAILDGMRNSEDFVQLISERSTKYILPMVLDSRVLFRLTQESSYGWCESGNACGTSSVLAVDI